MALTPHYIADKSALAQLPHPQVSAVLGPLLLAGEVATCSIIEFEVLYSARSYADLVATRASRSRGFPLVPMIQSDLDRAIDIMEALARQGKHRAVGIPDLLIAAVAERAGLIVLHYDADFESVAAITGQPTQWVVARGSVP